MKLELSYIFRVMALAHHALIEYDWNSDPALLFSTLLLQLISHSVLKKSNPCT